MAYVNSGPILITGIGPIVLHFWNLSDEVVRNGPFGIDPYAKLNGRWRERRAFYESPQKIPIDRGRCYVGGGDCPNRSTGLLRRAVTEPERSGTLRKS